MDDEHPSEIVNEPGELRMRIRENPFRPLATSNDLPRGWYVPIQGNYRKLSAVIETVYPGAIAGLYKQLFHYGENIGFEATISRQTGRYKRLEQLDDGGQEAVVQQVCGGCIRWPQWVSGDVDTKPNMLLCPEPCDYWLSEALKTLNGDEGE